MGDGVGDGVSRRMIQILLQVLWDQVFSQHLDPARILMAATQGGWLGESDVVKPLLATAIQPEDGEGGVVENVWQPSRHGLRL